MNCGIQPKQFIYLCFILVFRGPINRQFQFLLFPFLFCSNIASALPRKHVSVSCLAEKLDSYNSHCFTAVVLELDTIIGSNITNIFFYKSIFLYMCSWFLTQPLIQPYFCTGPTGCLGSVGSVKPFLTLLLMSKFQN